MRYQYARLCLKSERHACGGSHRFGGMHNAFLQRYTSTGDPHILDSVREVIGLHKVSAGRSALLVCYV